MSVVRIPYDIKKIKVPRGDVHIMKERCKGCGFCVEFCPNDVLELSDKFNSKGYHPPRVVKPDRCVNCSLCQLICPEFAIWSTLIEEEEASIGDESGAF